MKTTLLIVAVSILLASISFADPGDTLWTKSIGGVLNEKANSMIETEDGGYLLVGYTESEGAGCQDVYIVKTDSDGEISWTRTYGGNQDDEAYKVIETIEGGYVIVGGTCSFGAGNKDVYLIKINAQGDSIWAYAYGSTNWDVGLDIKQTSDNGFIIAGSTGLTWDYYILRVDGNGGFMWGKNYGGSGTDVAKAVTFNPNGGYVIGGDSYSFGSGDRDFWVLWINEFGDTLRTRTYGDGLNVHFTEMQATMDGGNIMTGFTTNYGAGNWDYWIVKINNIGDLQWWKAYGGFNNDHAKGIYCTSDSGYIVSGFTECFGHGAADIWCIKMDSNGDSLWARTFGGSNAEDGESVIEASDSNYVIAGFTESFGAGLCDFYLVKVEGGARPQPVISIDMSPDNPPIQLPAGFNFTYEGILTNNTDSDRYTDVWLRARHIPTGNYFGPLKIYYDLFVPANSTRRWYPVVQHVSAYAATGGYYYIASCGEWPENNIVDSCYFTVTVTAPDGSAGNPSWYVYGWGGTENTEMPAEINLIGNFPNPFNSATAIEYALPSASEVKLEVYNLMGKKVATLVNGWTDAGRYSVNWDASQYSSGIYFYKLTAGDKVFMKKMTLLK